jgi:hypothetical protein
MNTAYYRKQAQKAESELRWSDAAELWDKAAKAYPSNSGALAKLDIANMKDNARSCRDFANSKAA